MIYFMSSAAFLFTDYGQAALMPIFTGDIDAYFEVSEENCLTKRIYKESSYYGSLFLHDSPRSDIGKTVKKERLHLLFRYISTYLCNSYAGGVFK